MAISGGSNSDLLRTVLTDSTTGQMVGSKYINLERKSKAVVMYMPKVGEALVLDAYSSPSYSKHTKRPYSIDDRVFITTKWHGSGKLDLEEYDPVTLRRVKRIGSYAKGDGGNFSVAADTFFYRTESEYDMFRRRSVGGDYFRASFKEPSKKTKLGGPGGRLALKSSGEELYAVELPLTDTHVTAVHRLDPATGQVAEQLVTFEIADFDKYLPGSWGDSVVDNQVA